jgi:hypothetical protein
LAIRKISLRITATGYNSPGDFGIKSTERRTGRTKREKWMETMPQKMFSPN